MKKAVIAVFVVMLVLTFGLLVYVCVSDEAAMQDDIFGPAYLMGFTVMMFVPIFLAECDLFYNAMYIFSDNKRLFNTVVNVTATILSVMAIALMAGILTEANVELKTLQTMFFTDLAVYVVLRLAQVVVNCVRRNKNT